MKCIVRTSQEFLKLVEETNLSPIVLDMKIGKWQEENNSDEFPSVEEIISYTKNTPEVNMIMKSVTILQSSKGEEVFRKGDKNNWTIDKMLQELQVPKEQQELIKSFNTRNREEILTSLLANYSYTVEVNTASHTQGQGSFDMEPGIPFEATLGHDAGENTSYYSNLTVPGGTNYTENEIATPAITPSIKGHAQFATDNGIGWFRSDEAQTKDDLQRELHTQDFTFEQLLQRGEIKQVHCG